MSTKRTYAELEKRVQELEKAEQDRRQKEEALREERDLAREYLDIAAVAILVIDTKGNVSFINKKGSEILGYDQEEIIGADWFGFLPPGSKEDVRSVFRRLISGQIDSAEYYENPVVTESGQERVIAWNNTLLKDENGNLVGTLSSGQDITGRKRVEEALRRSQRLLEETQRLTKVGGWEYDAKEQRTTWTDEVYRIHGVRKNEFDPNDLQQDLDFYAPKDRKTIKEAFSDAMHQGKPYDLELRFDSATGDRLWVRTIGNPVMIKGKVRKVFGIIMDITERIQAEEERVKLQEQLIQAQKMESVGRLAGGVAHDFNNLLSPILAYSEMLLDDLPGADSRRQLAEEIRTAARRASDLTRQLLAFGRKQTLEIQTLDLNQIVKDFEKLLRRTIREDVSIKPYLSSRPLPVRVDRGQMEQVLMNLAINAQDAMPGGGTMTVTTQQIDLDEDYARTHQGVTPGPHAMLAVSDTGVGMERETLEQIFDPFFTTKTKGEGTGLGLATVYGIVKQHGGNIWVYSEPGLGAVFKVYLPLNKEAQKESEPSPEREKTATRGTETILVVEDDDKVRKLAATILENRGYTVLQAGDGQMAQDTVRSEEGAIHLLLTDVVMPGMNGREVYRELASLRPGLKVLYMSGYTDDVISQGQILEEKVEFIQKPFGVEQLAAKVREVLDQEQAVPMNP
ncbi:MAG: PAS domain S-box protein [Desulfohalobiaceae bacterium]|nr:PAS domain S-box protein [Desulfohalobiaceae bacterium]